MCTKCIKAAMAQELVLPSGQQPVEVGEQQAGPSSGALWEGSQESSQIIALCHCRTEISSSQRWIELDWVFSLSQTVVISHSSLVPCAQLLRSLSCQIYLGTFESIESSNRQGRYWELSMLSMDQMWSRRNKRRHLHILSNQQSFIWK